MHAETLVEYPTSLVDSAGAAWVARACGRARPDGLWEGWIEFEREDATHALRTMRETTQPNRADLVYWANGLGAVYLEGAFRRASEPPPKPIELEPSPPAFAGPAPGPGAMGRPPEPLLDPFEAYASGEETLRQRLSALAAWHLRNIARARAIVVDPVELEAMTKPELVERITSAARSAAAGELAASPPSH
jgi:hypothetical protein